MTRKEANFISAMNMCDEISNEAYKKIMCHCEEQEPILDKISAEIMQLDYDLEDVDYDYDDMAQTETVHIICREQVLQIIDKYRGESKE